MPLIALSHKMSRFNGTNLDLLDSLVSRERPLIINTTGSNSSFNSSGFSIAQTIHEILVDKFVPAEIDEDVWNRVGAIPSLPNYEVSINYNGEPSDSTVDAIMIEYRPNFYAY
jgi:hypothetical protein